ncbi:MAG: hypothetical protein Q3962_04595 [Corynebacterium sp.]|nr:hypothetical protein [Corynebacterium sp.]
MTLTRIARRIHEAELDGAKEFWRVLQENPSRQTPTRRLREATPLGKKRISSYLCVGKALQDPETEAAIRSAQDLSIDEIATMLRRMKKLGITDFAAYVQNPISPPQVFNPPQPEAMVVTRPGSPMVRINARVDKPSAVPFIAALRNIHESLVRKPKETDRQLLGRAFAQLLSHWTESAATMLVISMSEDNLTEAQTNAQLSLSSSELSTLLEKREVENCLVVTDNPRVLADNPRRGWLGTILKAAGFEHLAA